MAEDILPFDDLDPKRLRAIGQKLDRALDPDGFKHFDILGKHSRRPALLLWHLVRHGLVMNAPQSVGLLRVLAEEREEALTEDILALLQHLPEDLSGLDRGRAKELTGYTDGMLCEIDDLITQAILTDPDLVRAAAPALPPAVRRAVAFVTRRAGERIDPALAHEIFEGLLDRQVSGRGFDAHRELPFLDNGQLVNLRLSDPQVVRVVALLFGSEEAWIQGLLRRLRERPERLGAEADRLAERVPDALQAAELPLVVELFRGGAWTTPKVMAIFGKRPDPPAALLDQAQALLAAHPGEGRLAQLLAVLGILRATSQGASLPEGLEALFDYRHWAEEDGVFLEQLRRAVAALPAARARALLERVAADPEHFPQAALVADFAGDDGWIRALYERMEAAERLAPPRLLGAAGDRVLATLHERLRQARKHRAKTAYRSALGIALGRAFEEGALPEAAYDEYLDFALVDFEDAGLARAAVALFAALPVGRANRVMQANLAACAQEPWRLFRMMRPDLAEGVVRGALAALVSRREAVVAHDLGEGLRVLGPRAGALLQEALAGVAIESSFLEVLSFALDRPVFEAVRGGLSGALESPQQELARRAGAIDGPKIRVYQLGREEREPRAGEVARIGGEACGVAESPCADGEPMAHVLTLDLRELPELQARYPGVRALSLFVPDPDSPDRHEAGALLASSEAEVRRTPGATEGAAALVLAPFDLPAAVFAEEPAEEILEIRDLLLKGSGHLLGGPLWVLDGERGLQDGFVLQFEQSLCPALNLGDMGALFVFRDRILWQSY